MSNQTKLRTIYPNNSLKQAFRGMKESEVYFSDTDFKVSLEDIHVSSDVRLSVKPTSNNRIFTVRIPPAYKIIQAMWFSMKLAGSLKTNEQNFWTHWQFSEIRVQYPGVEDIIVRPQDGILHLVDCFKNQNFINKYRYMSGQALTTYPKGFNLMMFLPLIMNSLSSDNERKPLPIHKMGEAVSMTFTLSEGYASFLDIVESIDLHWTYGDLAEANQYMQLETYDYPLKLYYTNRWNGQALADPILTMPTAGATHSVQWGRADNEIATDSKFNFKLVGDRKRSVTLTNLRPGETQQIYLKAIQTNMCANTLKFTSTAVGGSHDLCLNAFQRSEGYMNANAQGEKVVLGNLQHNIGSRLKNIVIRYAGQSIHEMREMNYEINEINCSDKIASDQKESYSDSINRTFSGLTTSYTAAAGTDMSGKYLDLSKLDRQNYGFVRPTAGIQGAEQIYFFVGATNLDAYKVLNKPFLASVTTPSYTTALTGHHLGANLIPVITECVNLVATSRHGTVAKASVPASGFAVKTTIAVATGVVTIAGLITSDDKSSLLIPEKVANDYIYEINFAQYKNNKTNNKYSAGVDFSFTNIVVEFEVDSDDPNLFSAEAENAGQYTLEVTQTLQSLFKFHGQTVTLIQ